MSLGEPSVPRVASLLQKEWKDLERENEKNEITGRNGPPGDYDYGLKEKSTIIDFSSLRGRNELQGKNSTDFQCFFGAQDEHRYMWWGERIDGDERHPSYPS